MALGKSKPQNNNKLFILKPRTADAEKKSISPIFEVTEKVDEKWQVTGATNDVSGTITKVETYEKEYEGTVTPLVKVFLEDSDKKETYLLDLRYNMLSRNLFNSLCSLQSFEGVEIGLYERKQKDSDKVWPAVSVKQNDQRVDWAFKMDELPKVEKVKVGKKEVTSFDDLNDFFITELGKLAKRVAAPVAEDKAPAKKSAAKKQKEVVAEVPADPLDAGADDFDDASIPF